MRRRATAVAALLAGSLLSGAATAAAGDPAGTRVTAVTAPVVSVGAASVVGTVTARVATASLSTTTVVWELQRRSGACDLYASGAMTGAKDGTFSARWQASASSLATDDCSGTATLTVTAVDVSRSGGTDRRTAAVSIRRSSEARLTASASTVRRGVALDLRGQALVWDWDRGQRDGLSRHSVQLQRKTTDGRYVVERTLQTSATGSYAVRTVPADSTCWRAVVVATTSTSTAATSDVCVRVTR